MLRTVFALAAAGILSAPAFAGTAATDGKASKKVVAPAEEPVPLELFSTEFNFVNSASLRGDRGGLGDQNEVYFDIKYSHRIQIKDHIYLRLGVEWERFDFGTTNSPVPNHLQGVFFPIALEYIVQGFAGAAVEITPGWWFQNDIEGDAFDIPWRVYGTVPLKEKKLYAVVGVAGAGFYSVKAFPIGGLIWLINDTTRIEAVFPKSSIVCVPNETWEYRVEAELKGGGYRTGDNPVAKYNHTRVELVDYRAGALVTYKGLKGIEIGVGAGWSFERDFYYYGSDKRFKTGGAPYGKLQVSAEF